MGVLLIHDTATNGTVKLAEGNVAGSPTPVRTYRQQGRFLHVEGEDHVVLHDAAEIQRIPGYRVATAQEQEEFFGGQRKAHVIHEAKEPAINETTTKASPKGRIK
jgi:hypothetical protein